MTADDRVMIVALGALGSRQRDGCGIGQFRLRIKRWRLAVEQGESVPDDDLPSVREAFATMRDAAARDLAAGVDHTPYVDRRPSGWTAICLRIAALPAESEARLAAWRYACNRRKPVAVAMKFRYLADGGHLTSGSISSATLTDRGRATLERCQ